MTTSQTDVAAERAADAMHSRIPASPPPPPDIASRLATRRRRLLVLPCSGSAILAAQRAGTRTD